MDFTTIYKNGKCQNFFIKLDRLDEFQFLHPYFLLTTYDRPRYKSILEMDCLFAGDVFYGRQKHGYGYACCADVYGSLICAIQELHKAKLSEAAMAELNAINHHNERLNLSDALLDELGILNSEFLDRRYTHES